MVGRWRVPSLRTGSARASGRWFLPTLVVLGASLAALFLAGCGAPEYTYVTNSEDRTYVRIPTSWRQIDQRALDDAVGLDPGMSAEEQGLWMQGYDADPSPSPMHLFGPEAAAPAAFISVQHIPERARGQFSFDRLRDLFYPVSPTTRQQLATVDPTGTFSDFALMKDEVLTPGDGLRGVHTVFRYRMAGGRIQVVDQTAYLNDDASTLYAFFVRCSSECYEQHRSEIQAVVSSYTVRGKP